MAELAREVGTRCGYVALLGAPNAGKSTLLNRLVGAKVSIVTPKVQTTRARVLGIASAGDTQIVFIDTPGIIAPRKRLERAMVQAAWAGARDADVVVVLVDARGGIGADSRRLLDRLAAEGRQAVAAINKVDAVKRPGLLALAAALDRETLADGRKLFTDVFMISALTGDGVADLLHVLARRMPAGPWLYPEDQAADMPLRLLAAEITREQLFLQLRHELPYEIAVETEAWSERADGSVRIDQVIYVRRDSQRMIVLGKGGRQIKAVGSAARAGLEAMLGQRVHLFLHVKVREDWPEDPERYRDLGLDYDV
ncbi:MAG TPA: GTPase Era [Alphaproteobacteria bacterium]